MFDGDLKVQSAVVGGNSTIVTGNINTASGTNDVVFVAADGTKTMVDVLKESLAKLVADLAAYTFDEEVPDHVGFLKVPPAGTQIRVVIGAHVDAHFTPE
jgi:hypothetical protein